MGIKIFSICLFILFLPFGFSYAESDILGCGKVTWGMTHSHVSKIYKISEWDEKYLNCKLREKITIQGEQFSVVFQFDQKSSSGKLIGVSLPFSIENVSENHIDKIRDSITSKYGPPDFSEKKVGSLIEEIKNKNTWIKKSGKIEFETIHYWNPTEKKFILFGFILYSANLDKDKL
jgi:hypothetical protein